MANDSRVENQLESLIDGTSYTEKPRSRIEKQLDTIISSGISGATKWTGVTTTALTDGAEISTITIKGEEVTATEGMIVSYGGSEFIFDGISWQEFGSGSGSGGSEPYIPSPESGDVNKVPVVNTIDGDIAWKTLQSIGAVTSVNNISSDGNGNVTLEYVNYIFGTDGQLRVDYSDGRSNYINVGAIHVLNMSSSEQAQLAQLYSPVVQAAIANAGTTVDFSLASPLMALNLIRTSWIDLVGDGVFTVIPIPIDSNFGVSAILEGFSGTLQNPRTVTFGSNFDYNGYSIDMKSVLTTDGELLIHATARKPSYTVIPTGMHNIPEVKAELRTSTEAMSYADLHQYLESGQSFVIPILTPDFDANRTNFDASAYAIDGFNVDWDDITYSVTLTFDTGSETFTVDTVGVS